MKCISIILQFCIYAVLSLIVGSAISGLIVLFSDISFTTALLWSGGILLGLFTLLHFVPTSETSAAGNSNTKETAQDKAHLISNMLEIMADPKNLLAKIKKSDFDNLSQTEDALDKLTDIIFPKLTAAIVSEKTEQLILDQMNPGQRMLYSWVLFNREVCNGGIAQFFYNDSSSIRQDVADGLKLLQLQSVAAAYAPILAQNNALLEENESPELEQKREAQLNELSTQLPKPLEDMDDQERSHAISWMMFQSVRQDLGIAACDAFDNEYFKTGKQAYAQGVAQYITRNPEEFFVFI